MAKPILQVESWHGRKRKMLVLTEPGVTRVLARFVDDMSAALFLDTINEVIKQAFEMGRTAAILRDPMMDRLEEEAA